MDVDPSEKGFEINTGKIPILLTLKGIKDLKPHEETVASDLHGIVTALERDPVLRHPIIADHSTGAVLDGTHRLAALSQLGCHTIPTALIDYQNPLVRVDRWFRMIAGETLDYFLKRIEQSLNPLPMPASQADQGLLSRLSYATLRDQKECLAFRSNVPGALEAFQKAFRIEEIAREINLKISYTDDDDLKQLPETSFLMSTIRAEKSEVIESCKNRRLFPPKSTRHLIPSRPLGVAVPLNWLKKKNDEEAEKTFVKHLRSKHVRRLAEGAKVGSRRYLEEAFLFE